MPPTLYRGMFRTDEYMKKHFGRILFATLCLMMTSCGVHTNGTKATENSTTDVTQVVEAGAVCGAPSAAGASDCGADGEPSAVEAGQTGDAQNSEAQRGAVDAQGTVDAQGAVDAQGVAGTAQEFGTRASGAGNDGSGTPAGDGDRAVAEQGSEHVEEGSDAQVMDGVADDMLIQCEARIDRNGELYTAQAVGPTIEEARDNAIVEACSIPCAESLESKGISDDELEKEIDACAEQCSDEAIVIAAVCMRKGVSIYTEGAWNENGDPAPTNGSETSK